MSDPAPAALADAIQVALRAKADPARAVQEARYLRSSLRHLGVRVPDVRRAAREALRAAPALTRAGLRALVDALWARGIHECRLAGVEVLVERGALLGASDLPWLERLCREARTWALLDPLAAHVLGPLCERELRVARAVGGWTADQDFWIRRAALLAHLVALREGRGDLEGFGALAGPLLGEREFFIRKAIGWILRDTAKRRPAEVAAWLLPRAALASALTVREAVKPLPAKARAAILSAAGLGGGRVRARAAGRSA
jgi:3-methyladenine DNA glycosylase AlkD